MFLRGVRVSILGVEGSGFMLMNYICLQFDTTTIDASLRDLLNFHMRSLSTHKAVLCSVVSASDLDEIWTARVSACGPGSRGSPIELAQAQMQKSFRMFSGLGFSTGKSGWPIPGGQDMPCAGQPTFNVDGMSAP